MKEDKLNEKAAREVAETLAGIVRLHLLQAANAVKYDRNPCASENFHYREGLDACARLDLFLCELGPNLPEEFDEYKQLVKRQAAIWGAAYERIKYEASLVDWRSRPSGMNAGWHIGKKPAARVVRVYEQEYSDEGVEEYVLRAEKELAPADTLFGAVPRSAVVFECVIESQELRLDVERTVKANNANVDSEKGARLLRTLQNAAADEGTRYLLQQFYERYQNGR